MPGREYGPRFSMKKQHPPSGPASSRTIAEIAGVVGGEVEGDSGLPVTGVAGLREAQPGDVSFLADPRYLRFAERTRATAIVVGRDSQASSPAVLVRVDDPLAAFGQIASLFSAPPAPAPEGIDEDARVSAGARLGDGVGVGPYAVVEDGARLGDRTRVWAGCYVGHGVSIGEDCILYPQVSIREHCRIGDRVILHNGTVIGADGFGYEADEDGVRTKIPQIGIVAIGNDVEIGANCTIDRGRFGQTRIGNGVKIDNLVMVAHNCVVEDHAVLVAQVGIAGSTIIGTHAILGGQAGIAGHLVIGEHAAVGAQGGVTKDVPAGAYVTGYPATPHAQAAKMQAGLKRLPHLRERVAGLEAELRNLKAELQALKAGLK
jgi:UDP-3-O-[3-hydroxymyristoyl] glucosamine N-acyltransferase